MSQNEQNHVSAKLKTPQVYSFTNGNGLYDQLVIEAPSKPKENAINKFQYLFLEKKNRDNFESMYEKKLQQFFRTPYLGGGEPKGKRREVHADRTIRRKRHSRTFRDTLEMENTTISSVYGRGRRKSIRDRSSATTSCATIVARPTTEYNPNVITVVDQNRITDSKKSENLDINENQSDSNVRKSTR